MSRVWLPLVLALFVGCGDGDKVASPIEKENSGSTVPVEANWDAQIAAVRAGESDKIRIGSRMAEGVEWSDLAAGCDQLRSLWVEEAKPRDADLDLLASLENLEALALTASIDDDDLARIANCRGLKRLNLPHGDIGDEGFAAVTQLAELEQLRIGSPRLTDEGLASLRALPNLRFLHLIDVPISDAGLSHVAAVATLESFYLDGGEATPSGLRTFLRKRPDVHFHKDQLHLPGDPNAHAEE